MCASTPRPLITLSTDFGTADGYVAAVKGVLVSRLAGVQLIDLTHELTPGDIRAAAQMLHRSASQFPSHAVHLVVVDPGVGTDRAILALDHPSGRFVGPDNGVLDSFLDGAGAFAVDRPDLYLPAAGETFHGRDRMAPVAAALAAGAPIADLGAGCPQPVRLPALPLVRTEDRVAGSVTQVDRFGNAITNIPWEWLKALPPKICAWVGDRPVCRQVTHYAQLPEDRPGFLCGSENTVELALNCRSLADAWSIQVGTPVVLRHGGREGNAAAVE